MSSDIMRTMFGRKLDLLKKRAHISDFHANEEKDIPIMRILTALVALGLTLPLAAQPAKANNLLGENFTYLHGENEMEGYWVNSSCKSKAPAPVVLIVHQWKGITDHERISADKLSKECYNAFVVDMYGKGIRPTNNKDAGDEASLYKNNPPLARDRLQSALALAKEKAGTDKAAIMGYCFGGTMALELARSGADIAAAISFHGGLGSKAPATEKGAIKAAIWAHHGDADPHVSKEEIDTFFEEMRTVEADWVFTRYADAVHAFTEKGAGNDPSTGAAYNEKASKRSWASTIDFFDLRFNKASAQ